jgi:protein O-GlcNAc transferase
MPRLRVLLVSALLLALAGCDAKKKGAPGGPRRAACADAESAAQLIKRARKLAARGEREAALRCLEAGSRRYEASGEVWEEYGALTEDMGMSHEALELLERAIALKPTLGLAALRLGNIYAALNDDDRAIRFFKKASKARPDSPVPHNNIGLAHMRNGRTQEALAAFRRGMDETPPGAYGQAMILNNMGLLLKQAGNLEEAVESFQQALASEPSVEATGNLATILLETGSYEQALELCAGVLEQGKAEKLVLELAVSALALLDRFPEAAALLQQVGDGTDDKGEPTGLDTATVLSAAIDRLSSVGQPMAAVDLLAIIAVHRAQHFVQAGQLLTQAHQREEQRLALRAYVTALRLAYDNGSSGEVDEDEDARQGAHELDAGGRRLDPANVQAMRGLSLLLYQMTRYRDAEAVFRKLLSQTQPPLDAFSLAEGYNGLGASIEMSHTRLDEAVGYYAEARKIKPEFLAPFFSEIHLLGRICDWRQWESHFEKARALIDQGASGGMGPIFALAYPLTGTQLCSVTRNRAAEVEQRVIALREHHLDVWHAQLWLSAAAPTAPANVDTLALAIVSADLNARPVGQLVQGIFERLDRKRFEVFCFSLELYDGSEPARRMIEAVTEFQFVKGLDSRLVSEMINSVQAHIMIDLNGYTDGGRSELMPLRPAPVTVAYLGYPYTMALNGVDYTVTDRVVTPPEQYTSCFAEHLAYLPQTYMVSDHRQSHAASITGTFSVEEAKMRWLRHTDSEVFFFLLSNGFGTRILRWSWQTSYMSFM